MGFSTASLGIKNNKGEKVSSTGLSYYESARQEIIERLRLRDHIILSYIISTGAVFGIALSQESNIDKIPLLVLIIPFICMGVAILVASHSIAITSIGLYVDELAPAINECRKRAFDKKEDDRLPNLFPWDSSKVFKDRGASSSLTRMIGNSCIILVPSLFSLFLGYAHFKWPLEILTDFGALLWLFGVISTIIGSIVLFHAHSVRKNPVII